MTTNNLGEMSDDDFMRVVRSRQKTRPLHKFDEVKPVLIHLPPDVIEAVKSRVLFGRFRSVDAYLSSRLTYDVRRKHIRTRPKNGGKL